MKKVAEAHPQEFIKYTRGIKELCNLFTTSCKYAKPDSWRVWQEELYSLVTTQEADDRKIIWYADPLGAGGKTTFMRYMVSNPEYRAIALSGKIADMAYSFNGHRIVFFDLTRTQAEHMDHIYSFAETLKGGVLYSTKYEPVMKVFAPPWIVVFANICPDMYKWSQDRYVVNHLSEAPPFTPVTTKWVFKDGKFKEE